MEARWMRTKDINGHDVPFAPRTTAAAVQSDSGDSVQDYLNSYSLDISQLKGAAAEIRAALGGLTFAINAYDHGLDITYTEQEEG